LVNPPAVDLEVVRVNEAATREVEVRNTGEADLLLHEFAGGPTVSLLGKPPERLAPGESGRFAIAVAPARPGIFQSHVAVATNDPERPTVTVPVAGYAASAEQVERLLTGVSVMATRDPGPHGRLQSLTVINHEPTPVQAVFRAQRTQIEPGRAATLAAPAEGDPSSGDACAITILVPTRLLPPGSTERRPG
jgi:hypothetical protein